MSRKKRKRPRKPRPRKPKPKRTQAARPRRRTRPPEVPLDSSALRWKRLFNKVVKDPDAALRDPRCCKTPFLDPFLDLCESRALEAPGTAPDLLRVVLALAEKNGDPHVFNRASGVAVHVLVNTQQLEAAQAALDEYREAADACCRECVAEWFRRQGDLLVETQDPVKARLCLDLSARMLGDDLDDDTRGRILFVRGIAHHFLGFRDQALADVDQALLLLCLTRSRGYFLDAVAFVACFLQGGDEERHDERALEILAGVRRRLNDPEGVGELRARVRRAEGSSFRFCLHQVMIWRIERMNISGWRRQRSSISSQAMART